MEYIPQWSSAENKTLEVKALHQDLDAAVDFAQNILLGNEHIFKDEFSGVRAAHSKLIQLAGA